MPIHAPFGFFEVLNMVEVNISNLSSL